jgi:ribosomal protein S18 acetylase RimI-like enzyme
LEADVARRQMRGTPAIRPADGDDAPAVVRILAESFHDDPVSGWVFADPERRVERHRAMFAVFVEFALSAGRVYRAGDAGAAIWLDPDRVENLGERVVAALGDADGAGGRFGQLGELMDVHHPQGPHAYLPFIGVVPDQRNRGLGGAMLAHHLAVVDGLGLPAYLEASAPRSRQLYRRHGYADHGEPIRLPSGPCMWPMWRPAREPGAVAP